VSSIGSDFAWPIKIQLWVIQKVILNCHSPIYIDSGTKNFHLKTHSNGMITFLTLESEASQQKHQQPNPPEATITMSTGRSFRPRTAATRGDDADDWYHHKFSRERVSDSDTILTFAKEINARFGSLVPEANDGFYLPPHLVRIPGDPCFRPSDCTMRDGNKNKES
jgi:hypothetical protein